MVRQYNAKIKRTNNDLQNSKLKAKDLSNTNPTINRGELRCSGKVAVPPPHVAPVDLSNTNPTINRGGVNLGAPER